MTDEQLDEQIRKAYTHAELSTEAEDRILANLLAADAARHDTGTPAGEVAAFPARRRRPMWLPAAVAAVLLIGVFLGNRLMPTLSANTASDGAASQESAEAVGGEAPEKGGYSEGEVSSADAASGGYDAAEVPYDRTIEAIVLSDGRRLAIQQAAAGTADSNGLVWEDAAVEDTDEPCQVAALADGTYLVRFADDDMLYEAVELR